MTEPDRSYNPHNAISSYFIGPKAENMDHFQENIIAILDQIKDTRVTSEFRDDDGGENGDGDGQQRDDHVRIVRFKPSVQADSHRSSSPTRFEPRGSL